MSSNDIHSFKLSDKKHLYLYKEHNGSYFYCIENNQEKCYLKPISILEQKSFNQPTENLTTCTDRKVCALVLRITSDRGHTYGSESENRVAVCMKFEKKCAEKSIYFWVINVHLGLSKEDQNIQLNKLKKIIDKTALEKGIILCGDFNIAECSSPDDKGLSYKDLLDILNKAGSEREFIDLGPRNQVTFPHPKKSSKIDYMFFSKARNEHLEIKGETKVIPAENCSDHHALKATFSINKL